MKKNKVNKKSQKCEKQNLSEVVVEGTVIEARANAMFDVKLDNEQIVLLFFYLVQQQFHDIYLDINI